MSRKRVVWQVETKLPQGYGPSGSHEECVGKNSWSDGVPRGNCWKICDEIYKFIKSINRTCFTSNKYPLFSL
jgi:hypothetical protein